MEEFNILLVDDGPITKSSLEILLSDEDYLVDASDRGSHALELLEKTTALAMKG